MSDSITERILEAKEKVEEMEKEQSELVGRKKALEEDMQSKGFKDVNELKQGIEKLEEQIKADEEELGELEKKLDEFEI